MWLGTIIPNQRKRFPARYLEEQPVQTGQIIKSCGEDESESDGALANVLKVLQRVHTSFFDEKCKDNIEDRDVRQVSFSCFYTTWQVVKTVGNELLKNCRIGATLRAKKQCNIRAT
ncbi:protein-serine/threonine phosphatase [Salvia divinorum]|uniref:Protein-serine/threonine phosphatase n=1 Tax=Salvia divinorum TaxID=28513 RepID=A0ABD1HBX3_SALDI